MFEDTVNYSPNTKGRFDNVGGVLFLLVGFSLSLKRNLGFTERKFFAFNRKLKDLSIFKSSFVSLEFLL
jgi:hypothetical protein